MLVFKKDIRKFSEEDIKNVLCQIGTKINDAYINYLLSNKINRLIFYSIGDKPDIHNCPCGLIYNVEKSDNCVNIYILFIATAYKFRKVGYASLFIKEFITFIKEKYNKSGDTNIKIILDSIMEAVTFYEQIGFKWVITGDYDRKLKITKDSNVEHFIMIYDVI